MSCPPFYDPRIISGTLQCCNGGTCIAPNSQVGNPDGPCNTASCIWNNPNGVGVAVDGGCNTASCINANVSAGLTSVRIHPYGLSHEDRFATRTF